jgi:hypothetical protein
MMCLGKCAKSAIAIQVWFLSSLKYITQRYKSKPYRYSLYVELLDLGPIVLYQFPRNIVI